MSLLCKLPIGRELPVSNDELARMTSNGLKMGVAEKEVKGFTFEVVKMGSAFELPYEQLAEDMGKIANLYKRPISQISELGDRINYLDDNAQSTGAGIIDFMQRVGGTASMVNITDINTAAFGSTLETLGEKAETASTAMNAVFSRLGAANAQSKPFKSMLNELGLEAHEVGNMMQRDAVGGIYAVMDAISKLPKESTMEKYWVPAQMGKNGKVLKAGYFAEQATTTQIQAVAELFGAEHWDTFSKLMQNRAELERQIALANSSAAKGSMTREHLARMQNASAKYALFKNSLSELAITAGTMLLPTLNAMMAKGAGLVSMVTDWANANPVLASTLTKVIAGGILLLGGISALALGITTLLAPLAFLKMSISALGGGFGLFSKLAMGGISTIKMIGTVFMTVGRMMLANPILLAITAIAVAAYLIYKNWEPIKGFFVGVWNSVVSAFQTGIDWIKNIIRSVDSVFANNPILTFLFPLIGIPRIIIANWSSISAFFSTIWTAISTATSTAVSAVWSYVTDKFNGIRNFLSTCMDIIKGIVSTAWTGLCNIFLTITPLGFIVRNFDDIMAFLTGLKDRFLTLGGNIMQGLVDGIKSKFNGLKSIWNTINSYMPEFMKKKMDIHSPSRVMAGLGGHIVGGLGVGLLGAFPQLKSQYNKVLSIFDGGVHRPALDKVKQVLPSIGRVSDRPSQSQRSSSIIVEGDTITLHIHAGAGQIGQDLVQQIEQVLNRRDRDKAARIRSSYLDQD